MLDISPMPCIMPPPIMRLIMPPSSVSTWRSASARFGSGTGIGGSRKLLGRCGPIGGSPRVGEPRQLVSETSVEVVHDACNVAPGSPVMSTIRSTRMAGPSSSRPSVDRVRLAWLPVASNDRPDHVPRSAGPMMRATEAFSSRSLMRSPARTGWSARNAHHSASLCCRPFPTFRPPSCCRNGDRFGRRGSRRQSARTHRTSRSTEIGSSLLDDQGACRARDRAARAVGMRVVPEGARVRRRELIEEGRAGLDRAAASDPARHPWHSAA